MTRSLALIHTVVDLVAVFAELTRRHLADWEVFNIVDESLLKNTIRSGELSKATMRRLAGHVCSAVDAGADAIMVTCSSVGPAVDATIPF
ncbi:MAG: Asp/Glu/hydantoin racemase, partial [Alphaproteobacteria bacterium]|nr:Asp/Glu/hydantoin racemase [Alphaproteobacteria bacterium]